MQFHTNNNLHNKASTNKHASGLVEPDNNYGANIWVDLLGSTRLSAIIFTVLLPTSQVMSNTSADLLSAFHEVPR